MFPGGYGKDQQVRVLIEAATLDAWEAGRQSVVDEVREAILDRIVTPSSVVWNAYEEIEAALDVIASPSA